MSTMDRLHDLEIRASRLLDQLEAEEDVGRIHDAAQLHEIAKEKRRWRVYEKSLQKNYGLSVAAYRELYRIQQGRCAICEMPHERLVVDHCHDTERVRGLLCGRCNLTLGVLRENLQTVRGMMLYIERRCIPAKQAGRLERTV